MTGAEQAPVVSVMAAIGGLFMAYLLFEALRTGELKGRNFMHRRATDPGTYWFGVAVLLALCCYFAFQALG